ncbi:sugar ABC transporter substrate-binding protein [Tessaracoccus antarcticus]|uniref:Extracellular solute-binding protein n=1 Tax=Tessaracoccus antarcticus TaxID=2479848 RepID=A0A3M0G586_9ACTN|nr:sugar ABC transporter substrate-binding protein [Tessaracoccus antarcticus]RMB59728.1 extracellular solute-binding protein [Tessaracoccus antarcticus]
MKNRMRTAAALTALLALVGMSACGRDAGGDTTNAPSQQAVDTGKATGTLTMWAMGTEGDKLPDLVKKFEADNPDVKVEVTAIPWNSAHDKFTAAIAAGTTPDLAMIGTTWMGEFVGLKALDPTPEMIDPSKFFEGAQATTVVQDTSYGVPWYVETRLVFYRTDIAKKAGITEAPTTWEGLHDMAKAMQDKGGSKWGISLQPGQTGSWQTVVPFMWSNGGEIVNKDMTAFTFDDPKNVEALKYYQSFFTDGIANKAPAQGTTEADFASGAAPMFISGPWMMASVETAGGAGFADKYDVALMPKKEISASFVGGSNLGVFKSTENRDAAWKLVDFLTTDTTQVEWFGMSTDLPSVQSAWDDESLKSDAKLAKFGTQLKTAFAPPPVQTWEQVSASFDAQVEKVTKTGTDPGEALKTVQQEATSIGMG